MRTPTNREDNSTESNGSSVETSQKPSTCADLGQEVTMNQDSKTALETHQTNGPKPCTSPNNMDLNEKDADGDTKNCAAFNPNLPEDEENEILERLRGDAIGTTLYSERFVISALLKLGEMKESLENDEKFEQELESLWDMTIESDVVQKLIALDVYEIFTESIIKYDKDSRLIEILVGIIGNMCTVSEEALEQLCENETTVQLLLELLGCGDTCVLIQLMRLLNIVYGSLEAAKIWNAQIITNAEYIAYICFILKNSNSQTLLNHTLETLNAILAKCAIISESCHGNTESNPEILVKIVNNDLVVSTTEAFQTFCANENIDFTPNETDKFMEAISTSETLKKTFTIFINIHDIFLNYQPKAFDNDSKLALRKCLNNILRTITTSNFVIAANIDFLQDIIDCLSSVFLASDELQNEDIVIHIIKLWQIVKSIIENSSNDSEGPVNEFEADDLVDDESFKELCCLTEKLLTILLKQASKGSSLKNVLQLCKAENALKILKLYGVSIASYTENNLDLYCGQLEKILNSDPLKS